MKFKLFIISILFTFIFSCKKDSIIPPCESQITKSYFPMETGSYWIYQWYEVDSSGTEELLDGKIDTVTIVKDTLIDTYMYKKIQENNSFITAPVVIKYRRDSLGFLIDPQNNIYFSSSNFIDTLRIINNSNFKIIYKMAIPTTPIETTAGVFDCLNFRGEVTPFVAVDWSTQLINNYYSRGIGKIQGNTFFFSNADMIQFQRRLIEYHLE
ncbi:MAG: hypothetical protein AB8H03_13310 [Saprospiraceae bacterium]